MARLNTQAVSSDTESERVSSSPNRQTSDSSATPPSPPQSSDKENERRSGSGKGKRKSATAGMSDRPPAESQKEDELAENPRRLPLVNNTTIRIKTLKNDARGLEETLREADELYKNVKQTSEATIDSRLLVETADLSYRKINNSTLGDGTAGIDVDDFVTKCIVFMKQGDQPGRPRNEPPRTQTQQRRRYQDDEEEDAGDTMNWEYLGKNACFLYNSRPCLTGFLLGPLSVQKKVRQQTQRKAREARTEPTRAVRPIQLGEEDLQKQESANLTEICTEIARLLQKAMSKGQQNAERDTDEAGDDASDEQIEEILRRHGIADNGCVPLFNFCVNPKSFGQSVENMFYVSFLIKEGKVGLDFDNKGLPTLGIAVERTVAERQETQRNQAIFTLDFDIWEDIIKSFGIEKSVIPHRIEEHYDDGTIDYASLEGDADVREDEQEDSDAYS